MKNIFLVESGNDLFEYYSTDSFIDIIQKIINQNEAYSASIWYRASFERLTRALNICKWAETKEATVVCTIGKTERGFWRHVYEYNFVHDEDAVECVLRFGG